MKINILTPKQMRELSSYGLDTSDASLYINDVTADNIDNGQLLVNLFPNDGSRQHEIEHSHVIFIYSIDDAMHKIPNANVQITNRDGMHAVNVYGEKTYESSKAIEDVDFIISEVEEAMSLCDKNKPWQLESIEKIMQCLDKLKNNIIAYPNDQMQYKEELIIESFNISQNIYYSFRDNLHVQQSLRKIIESLEKLIQSYKNIIFSYKSTKYNEVLFECMKYFLSNGKQLKKLS